MKAKPIALVAVIASRGFWAFGAKALISSKTSQITPFMLTTFAGILGGSLATLWLQRQDYKDLLTGKVCDGV